MLLPPAILQTDNTLLDEAIYASNAMVLTAIVEYYNLVAVFESARICIVGVDENVCLGVADFVHPREGVEG